MLVGPIFGREAVSGPRRVRHFLIRAVYVLGLTVLMCTAWLVLAGTQLIRDVGDMTRFGGVLFQMLAPLQLALVVFFSAIGAAAAVAQEKDRRTLVLLLLTRLSNVELVLGKLLASLLGVFSMLLAALPVFFFIALFGGVDYAQIGRVYAVTTLTAVVAGSIGSTLAFWREKTFQTLAMTALALVIWIAAWEAVAAGVLGATLGGIPAATWANTCSPLRAILLAASPQVAGQLSGAGWGTGGYLCFAAVGALVINGLAIARVRVWNPSREVRPGQERESLATIWDYGRETPADSGARWDEARAEAARAEHVDALGRARISKVPSRRVWDNPVLWREVCTWAYGRKVLVIRVVYLLFFALAAYAGHLTLSDGFLAGGETLIGVLPAAARPLLPFLLLSLVIVNALAVTAITSERDGQALDLLLVTDLTPKEIVLGKLGGVLWVTKEMVLLPLALSVYFWWRGSLAAESLCFLLCGLAVMNLFVSMLGIHCGMTYASSRTAVGVSLGTVFFLFLGVVTCIVVMISFSGSFQQQLAPFLAFILGGSVGLYVSLGSRNPSPAIALAALLLPFATFHAITSFFLGHNLTVFLVTAAVYGFTTAAMMIPAIGEFDIAMGRTKTAEEE